MMGTGSDTFEVVYADAELLNKLRAAGVHTVEALGDGYVNVRCYEQYSDAVQEILDDAGVGYRLI